MTECWQFKVEMYTEEKCTPFSPCILVSSTGNLLLNPATDLVLFPEGYGKMLREKPLDEAYLGTWNGRNCFALTIAPADSEGFSAISPREVLAGQSKELACMACMGKQLLHWRGYMRFCPACGSPLADKVGERARACTKCNGLYFPRINPAVIVCVKRGDEILLAHNRNFADGIFSLVAGYVEVGESLEQAVAREVLEEVGVRITNIQYWGSQPWPFPSSLMLGFTADYLSGDIQPDGTEITEADWFSWTNLPSLPSQGSIARRIVDCGLKEYQARHS